MGICCCNGSSDFRPKLHNEPSLSRLSSIKQHSKGIYTNYKVIEILSSNFKRTLKEAEGRAPNLGRKFIIESINKQDFRGKTDQLRKEIDFMFSLDHPGIVDFFEVYEDNKNFHIVSELCSGGSLEDFVLNSDVLTESILAKNMMRIIRSVLYLHSKGFVHGFLTSKSFMFTNFGLKLAKFGIAKRVAKEKISVKFSSEEKSTDKCSEEDDVRAVGNLLYFMLSAEYPFKTVKGLGKNSSLNFSGKRWDFVSNDAKNLITLLLEKDPQIRISLKDALDHPWFSRVKYPSNPAPICLSRDITDCKHHCLWSFILTCYLKYLVDYKIENIAEWFLHFETDNSGSICLDFLLENLDSSEKEKEHFKKSFHERITFSEFVRACCTQSEVFSEDLLKKSFSFLNLKGNDSINGNEIFENLQRKRTRFNDETIMKLLEQANIDLNAEIKPRRYIELVSDLKDRFYTDNINTS